MDVRLLRSFVEVATQQSISRAAERLGYSQPAVTQHVQRVERIVGGRLIKRGGTGVILTELGKRVLPLARVVVAATDELMAMEQPALRAAQAHWDS